MSDTAPPLAFDEEDKPAVLIVGGLGFIGRYLALLIHQQCLASEVRLVDKQLPELAWLSPEFREVCSKDNFVQADASRQQALPKVFDRKNGKQFDYVYNCAGETRFSQADEVYKLRSHALSLALGREAAKRKVKCFVECSTGMVYKPDPVPRKETDKKKPYLSLAKWKLQAEEDLAQIEGLKLVIMRLAMVYGPYATKYLSPALCIARVHQHLGTEMKWLWDKNLHTNTVHVEDVARALLTVAGWYVTKRGSGPFPRDFNIVDHGNTTQGTVAALIKKYFNIPTGFHGNIISSFARLNLGGAVDDLNEETLDPWAELQQKAGITVSTPISPFVEKELLKDNDVSLDGSLFERTTGFKYQKQKISDQEINQVVESYKRMGWWP